MTIDGWFRVEDILPGEKSRCLVAYPLFGDMVVGEAWHVRDECGHSHWYDMRGQKNGVTHWMPLPEPPDRGDE